MFAGERPTRFYLAKEEPDLSIDPVTGMIRIRVPLDRETRDKYILSVEARNGVTTGYCQVRVERTRWDIVDETNVHYRVDIGAQVELNVEDVNDNGPTFPTSSVRISVAESHPLHAPLYVAHATDPDVVPSHPIRYALGQNSNDLFGIDARSGELYLSRRLDYETQQRHGLLIRALDGGGLSANLSLSVEVQDVNDNPPVFERNEYHVEVPEGAKLDSQVRKIFITRPSRGHLSAGEGRAVGSPFSDMEMFTERRKNRKGGGEVLDLWEDSTLSFPFNSFSNSSSAGTEPTPSISPPIFVSPSISSRLVVLVDWLLLFKDRNDR